MTTRPLTEDDKKHIQAERQGSKKTLLYAGSGILALGITLYMIGQGNEAQLLSDHIDLETIGHVATVIGGLTLIMGLMKKGGDATPEGPVWVSDARLKQKVRDLEQGSYVVLDDPNMPRLYLPHAQIEELHKGDLLHVEYHQDSGTLLQLQVVERAKRTDGTAHQATEWRPS